jgi:hypothetical protein
MKSLFVILLTMLGATSCSNGSGFSGADRPAPAKEKDPVRKERNATTEVEEEVKEEDQVAKEELKEQIFSLSSQDIGKVDIVLIVDNSGSMREEAEQVRRNLRRFMDTLQARTDVKLALMSSTVADANSGSTITVNGVPQTGSTGVDLSADDLARGYLQIPTAVGSTNALAMLASASCDAIPVQRTANADQTSSLTLCGKTFNLGAGISLEGTNNVTEVGGKLKTFYREGAKRIFVTVTDDNARGIDQTSIVPLLTSASGEKPVMFTFGGIASVANVCSVAKRSEAYESLATSTNGGFYDICLQDWSPHFSKLSERVVKLLASTVEFGGGEVKKVLIDGVEIASDQYRVEGSKHIIKETAITAESKSITVVSLK